MAPFPIFGALTLDPGNPQSQFAKKGLRETAKMPPYAPGMSKDWDQGNVLALKRGVRKGVGY